jgi:hypothetical protein
MKTIRKGNIEIPHNEFLPKNPELFNLNLKMPARFKEEWLLFRKRCKRMGGKTEFEDVLGSLIVRFNKGEIKYKNRPPRRIRHG